MWHTICMEARKLRWAKTYEAGESELITLLEAQGIEAERWMAEEFEYFEPHVHEKNKRIWCAEGSITFLINGDKTIPLQAGDGLDMPANTIHEANAGFAGCICYESPPESQNPVVPINQ